MECPISHEAIPEDHLFTVDGLAYDERYLRDWAKHKAVVPHTRRPLTAKELHALGIQPESALLARVARDPKGVELSVEPRWAWSRLRPVDSRLLYRTADPADFKRAARRAYGGLEIRDQDLVFKEYDGLEATWEITGDSRRMILDKEGLEKCWKAFFTLRCWGEAGLLADNTVRTLDTEFVVKIHFRADRRILHSKTLERAFRWVNRGEDVAEHFVFC